MKKKSIKNIILENKKTIIILITTILFLIITYFTFSSKINTFDKLVETYILNIRNDKMTNIMITITNISSAYSLIVISILLLVIIKKKKIPLAIMINLISVFLISQLAKIIIRRPRPSGINLVEASGFSYPSGHSMVSMAYFGYIAYLIYKHLDHQLGKTILITTLIITSVVVGFSRIYLGVHYLSDVIAGFLLSIIYLIVFIKLYDKQGV